MKKVGKPHPPPGSPAKTTISWTNRCSHDRRRDIIRITQCQAMVCAGLVLGAGPGPAAAAACATHWHLNVAD